MTQQVALSEARRLQGLMAKHGVKCTIEIKIGRNDSWFTRKHMVMNHHTAGSSTGLTPSYALCRNGREGLPGPLCNGYGGRDHVYRIVCMGLANHPGAGGPLTLDGFTVQKDSARPVAWGTEWEHNGTSAWPADMVNFMARSNAAINEFLAVGVDRQCEHSTWTTRKIDRNQYTAQRGRDEILAYLRSVNVHPHLSGSIKAHYDSLPQEIRDIVGGPTGVEEPASKGGRYSQLERGILYWHPETGAHLVYGGILGAYDALRRENGQLGFPTSDEHDVPIGRAQQFQGGSLTWHSNDGSVYLSRRVWP